jgi:hypothetical protein
MTININKKRDMRKYAQKLMTISLIQLVLFSVLFGMLFVPTAYATNMQDIEFSIKQNIITAHASLPQDLTFAYQLVPKTSNAPMPDNSNLEKYPFMINGTDELLIAPITFGSPGVFFYEVHCITDSKAGFTIDRRTLTIEVHVTLSGETFVVLRKSNGDKVEQIIFEHIYEPPNTGGSGGNGGNGDSGNKDQTDKVEEPIAPEEITGNIEEATPEKSDETENEAGIPETLGETPKTGVESNQMLWIMLMMLSGLMIVFILPKSRKTKNAATL